MINYEGLTVVPTSEEVKSMPDDEFKEYVRERIKVGGDLSATVYKEK